MDSAKEKDGIQVQNNNFGTLKAFTFIKQSQPQVTQALSLPFLCQSDLPCIATRRNRGFGPRNAPPERGIFFRPQAYDRVGIFHSLK